MLAGWTGDGPEDDVGAQHGRGRAIHLRVPPGVPASFSTDLAARPTSWRRRPPRVLRVAAGSRGARPPADGRARLAVDPALLEQYGARGVEASGQCPVRSIASKSAWRASEAKRTRGRAAWGSRRPCLRSARDLDEFARFRAMACHRRRLRLGWRCSAGPACRPAANGRRASAAQNCAGRAGRHGPARLSLAQ